MTVLEAIHTINSIGADVVIVGPDHLKAAPLPCPRPPAVADALAMLKAHKAEVMALLTKHPDRGEWALHYAIRVAGARFVEGRGPGRFGIAVWQERRGPELDIALKTLRLDHLPLTDREL
jgi:hypothetical protein